MGGEGDGREGEDEEVGGGNERAGFFSSCERLNHHSRSLAFPA